MKDETTNYLDDREALGCIEAMTMLAAFITSVIVWIGLPQLRWLVGIVWASFFWLFVLGLCQAAARGDGER